MVLKIAHLNSHIILASQPTVYTHYTKEILVPIPFNMDSPINEFEQQNFTKLEIYENDEKQEQVNKQNFLAKFAQQ
jgi:hypothetical protein